MRPPRYQFPEIVRSATRTMVSRTIASHSVAENSEQLGAWIAGAPDVGESLRKGGYGTAFNADDLFPLYQVMVSKSLGVPPVAAGTAPAKAPRRGPLMIVAASIAVAIVLLLLAFATDAFPAGTGEGAARLTGVVAAPLLR